jgi:hypothetical protein
MRNSLTRSLIVFAGMMSLSLLHGQTTTVATVASSYPLTIPAGMTGLSVNTIELFSVSYPVGLTPVSQYISGAQFNKDFQGFLAAYPNLSDPPEAILSTVLQNILTKYPQITGGYLIGVISGPPTVIGGIPIPGSGTPMGTISVTIGTYNPTTGVITGLARTGPTADAIKSAPQVKQ